MQEELEQFQKNDLQKLIELPQGKKVLSAEEKIEEEKEKIEEEGVTWRKLRKRKRN